MKKFTTILTIALALIFSVFSISCGETNNNGYNKNFQENIELVAEERTDRIIYYFSEINIKSYDTKNDEALIKDKLNEIDGYATKNEHMYKGDRTHYAYLYLKVPTKYVLDFIYYLESNFNIKYSEIESQDITSKVLYAKAEYENKKKTLESYEEMLQSSLSASERMSVISSIDSVRNALAKAEQNLNLTYQTYDYSTVVIEIGKKQTFGDTLLDVLKVLLPIIAIVAFVILMNYIDSRRYKKGGRKWSFGKKQEKIQTSNINSQENDQLVADKGSENEEKDKTK